MKLEKCVKLLLEELCDRESSCIECMFYIKDNCPVEKITEIIEDEHK